jgi:hypothetical protein
MAQAKRKYNTKSKKKVGRRISPPRMRHFYFLFRLLYCWVFTFFSFFLLYTPYPFAMTPYNFQEVRCFDVF